MESAYNKRTGKIVDAEELWLMDTVDPFDYECRGCGAQAIPCSYRPDNKVRPYFRINEGHKPECDVEGEIELVKQASTQRIPTTHRLFRACIPNKLVLRETRPVTAQNSDSTPIPAEERYRTKSDDNNSVMPSNPRYSTAQTIRPLCRTFINYPFNRDFPLRVPDISGNTYQTVFRSLKGNQIIHYSLTNIFYAPLSWKIPKDNEEYLEIHLSYGEWKDNNLIRPYYVKVNWQNWSPAKRKYVSQEIETAREESILAKKNGSKEKGWLFFIGTQDENKWTHFHVNDHRLICCLMAEIIYPPK